VVDVTPPRPLSRYVFKILRRWSVQRTDRESDHSKVEAKKHLISGAAAVASLVFWATRTYLPLYEVFGAVTFRWPHVVS
jgi:hypothetical protein